MRTTSASLLLFWASHGFCQSSSITLYMDENYGGDTFVTSVNTPRIPNPLYKNASSFKITNADHAWTILWESEEFNTHDDQLWIEGSRNQSTLGVPGRPHGNNSWNDLIKAVSFSNSGPPWDGNDNRSICTFNGPCVTQAQRRIQANPVLIAPVPEHNGWFVRVCPANTQAHAINVFLGNHNDSGSHHLWTTWNAGDPSTFNLPMNFLYIRDIWLRGEGVPDGAQVSMCVGYHDHISWKYTFNHGEDHQPDQEDTDGCEC